MRNATVLAIAPNANIGLVAGTSPGIDPRFAQMFSRNKISGKYLEINPNLVADLLALGLWDKTREQILENHGNLADIAEIPDHVKNIYKTSFSTSPYAFIEIAARAQKWVDQAISRNMYLETRDINDVMNIYTTAWEKGLKTTYYLHMKPKHTAEQSTTNVNKSAALGQKGFSGLFQAKQTAVEVEIKTPTKTEKIEIKETVVSPIQNFSQVFEDKKPAQAVAEATESKSATTTQPVKTKATYVPLSEMAKAKPIAPPPSRPKVVVHGPEDPMDALLCDGCQ